ncbi:YcaO-like family protein [Pyxidicoccus parkwayensis]|uniref:YcaO-like family protein n=2 Tax=Pyxidicoccus parkwayensis TaxID=2813578 RepID=A0ABX7PCU5_9BACT|nr:YcaO-like family protein [Pyxidicoccus parkwaysis]
MTVRKHALAGTHRLIPPAETLERARRVMPELGITRIANVTGLDTLGIPVVMVVRPNARSLSVSQGKGVTLEAARASGLMEAIEFAHAEHIDQPLRLGSLEELRATCPVVDVSLLPRRDRGPFSPHLRTLWIAGVNVLERRPTWVPYELVHMDYTLPLPPGSGSFLMSSNGLASGNHPLEALNHALCELIERDATTRFRFSSDAAQRQLRVDLSTVDDPDCRELLERYERAGVEVAVWELTSDIGVAAFSCVIVDRDPDPSRPLGPMGGIGCHPCRAIALSRALTEAAQSRLTVITGARDDLLHQNVWTPEENLALARKRRDELAAHPPERSFRDAPDFRSETFNEDAAFLLEHVRAVGVREVIVVDLTRPHLGIPVVRVIAPGLEPLNDIPGYVPGPRASRWLRERAS